jgi:hypothetical protein
MLQEVCLESLQALRNDQWVQENFVMTDSDLPKSIHDEVEGDSFIMREELWKPAPHFTIMLLPKTLRTELFPSTFGYRYGERRPGCRHLSLG